MAQLFYYTVKGVKNKFHSRMPSILPVLFSTLDLQLRKLEDKNIPTKKTALAVRSSIISTVITRMLEHSHVTTSGRIISVLLEELRRLLTACSSIHTEPKSMAATDYLYCQLGEMLKVSELPLTQFRGNRIQDVSPFLPLFPQLFTPSAVLHPSSGTNTATNALSLLKRVLSRGLNW